jgi:predicted RNA-binding Zn ribbon-like protein
VAEPLPIELMNTIRADRDGLYDAITTPAELTAWLADHGCPDAATRSDLRGFRELRDALRRMAAEITDDDPAAAQSAISDLDVAVSVVNTAAANAPGWPELTWPDGEHPRTIARSAASGMAAVRGRIAADAIAFFGSPDRKTLRACRAPGCVLYFIRRHTRREWCSDSCGNRARVARHYQRHHAAG